MTSSMSARVTSACCSTDKTSSVSLSRPILTLEFILQRVKKSHSSTRIAALFAQVFALERERRPHALEVEVPPAHTSVGTQHDENAPSFAKQRRARQGAAAIDLLLNYQLKPAKKGCALILATPLTEPPNRRVGSFSSNFFKRSTAANESFRGYLLEGECGQSRGKSN